MGAPFKRGVDHFPLNTTMSSKMQLIEKEFGITGFAIVVRLYQKIFRERGYYCEWSTEVASEFARDNGVGPGVVSEVVSACIRRGIFHKGLYHAYSILSSEGIQKRYLQHEHVKRRGRVVLCVAYLVAEPTLFGYFPAENAENGTSDGIIVFQKRTKEKRKVTKENKKVRKKTTHTVAPTRESVAEYFLSSGCSDQAEVDAFMEYNEKRGWDVANNWQHYAERFMSYIKKPPKPVLACRQKQFKGSEGQISSFDVQEFYRSALARSYGTT